jgi:SAM-dependent methyltransferase
MHHFLVGQLRCPHSGQKLSLERPLGYKDEVKTGWLVSEDGQHRYPIREGIPRFVPEANYADNFGFQWNRFRQSQLDSFSGQPISRDRFWKATAWEPSQLAGRRVLDAGCGAGRFAEIALEAGASVVAVDYSAAVDACYANLKHHPNLHVIQADIYAFPFAKGSFDFVYSLGVLQHTPDVSTAFAALPPMLRSGGRLCVDFYEKSWKTILLPKYWLRPITTRLRKDVLFTTLETVVPLALRVGRLLRRLPVLGESLTRLVPVANYIGILPLSEEQHVEWSLLDTFDWFGPQYDQPQTATTVRAWMVRAGLKDIEVLKAGHLVGRGTVVHASGD